MNRREAEVILALLHHLDGSHVLDEADFLPAVEALHASAAAAFRGGSLPLDLDTIEDVLSQVAQRFSDAGYWDDEPNTEPPARDINDVATGGVL